MVKIPKIIHFIWFSEHSEIPELFLTVLDSWKKNFPKHEGWKFMFWDRSNIPEEIKDVIELGLANKQYANTCDILRLFVVGKYGGIYLDMDVYVTKPLDKFLIHDAFASTEVKQYVDIAILGSKPNNIDFLNICDDVIKQYKINVSKNIKQSPFPLRIFASYYIKKGMKLDNITDCEVSNDIAIYNSIPFLILNRNQSELTLISYRSRNRTVEDVSKSQLEIIEKYKNAPEVYALHMYQASWLKDVKKVNSDYKIPLETLL